MEKIKIRAIEKADRPWANNIMIEHWGATRMVSRGRVYDAGELPGFIAVLGNEIAGIATYHIAGSECELTTLNSLVEGKGIGTALLTAVRDAAAAAGCRRLWLISTNDNTHALHFYQKRGYLLVAVYRNAVEHSRKLKPEIPLLGNDGIPLRDEIELELPLK